MKQDVTHSIFPMVILGDEELTRRGIWLGAQGWPTVEIHNDSESTVG